MPQTDYLVIGHVAKDLEKAGFVLGGSAIYAATTAARLGRRAAVVTAGDPSLDLYKAFPTTPVCFAPSLTSTVFENRYRGGRREQHLHSRAADLQARHVPAPWRSIPLVHIAPIAREVTADILHVFDSTSTSFVGVTLQGWLRAWDRRGRVSFKPWVEALAPLAGRTVYGRGLGQIDAKGAYGKGRVRAAVFSEEDVEFREDIVEYFAKLAPVVAVTLGNKGAKVHWEGAWRHFPAFPAREVDPTGAGDVFAAAFFLYLAETNDPASAAEFANCAASFSVEADGTKGIPTLGMVEKRLMGES